jgi:molybdopterin converting factor small subunit
MVGVRVKLFGTFRPLLPADAQEGVWLTQVPAGTRAVDVLGLVGVPLDRLKTTVILVNGRRVSPDWILKQDDTLSAFPAMEGG